MPQPSEIKNSLQNFTPIEFESLVSDLWSEMGWSTNTTSHSQDKGIDIVARKSDIVNKKVVIQAKCYSAGNKVGRPAIQQYNTLQQQESETDTVIIVTSSDFTSEANTLAKKLGVKIINGDQLSDACVKNFDGRYISSNIISGRNNLQGSADAKQNKPSISVEELSAPEQNLAKVYDNHFSALGENSRADAIPPCLIFDINRLDGRYNVAWGSVHHIQFPSATAQLLERLKRTAKKYNWEVLETETREKGVGGIDLPISTEKVSTFSINIDTSGEGVPDPERQSKITSLILEKVYQTEISGMRVGETIPDSDEGTRTHVIE